jgi:hypothetical protein
VKKIGDHASTARRNVKQLQEIRLNEDLLLKTPHALWVQQHMVDRHYSLNLKPCSARKFTKKITCKFTTKNTPLIWEENYFFPALRAAKHVIYFCFITKDQG